MLQRTLLLTIANMLLRCVSIYFQVFLTGSIGAAGVGLMQLISSVSLFAMTLGTSGIRIGAMYLSAEEYGHSRPYGVHRAIWCCVRYGLVMSVITGSAVLLCAEKIALHWLQAPEATLALRFVGLFLPVSCLWSVMDGYFTACSKIGQVVLVDFLDRSFSMIATMALLHYWAQNDLARSCASVILGNSLGSSLGLIILFSLYRQDRKISNGRQKAPMWRRLFTLCIPLALNEYLRSGLSTLEHFLIPRGLSRNGASREASMAAYGTIHGMVFPILMFPAVPIYALSDLLVPELAGCRAKGQTERIHVITGRCLRIGFLFACCIAGLLHCLSGALGLAFYNSRPAGIYLQVFAPLVLILYMDAIVDGMHKGLGQQAYCVRYNTLSSFLDVLLLFFLLPRLGISGFVLTFTVSHCINFYLSLKRLLLVTGYRLHAGFICKVLLCTVFATSLCFSARILLPHPLAIFLLIPPLFLGTFYLISQLFSVIAQEDLRWLRLSLFPRTLPH